MPTTKTAICPTLDRAAFNEALLDAMAELNRTDYGACPPADALERLLGTLLHMTGSELGFIGQVWQGANGSRSFKTRARSCECGLSALDAHIHRITPLLDDLVATGEPLVTNTPPNSATDQTLTSFDSSLRQLMAIPLRVGRELIGVAAIGNRPEGYTTELLAALVPLTGAVAQLLYSFDLQEKRSVLEQELRIREERWNYALTGSGEGVFDWDIQNDTIYLSQQWKSILGYEDEALDNAVSTWSARLHPDDVARTSEVLEAYLAGRTQTYENEYRLQHRDGTWRWMLARGQVVAWTADGKPSRFVGTQTDITSRKTEQWLLVEARDAAVHSAKAKADFLAIMTHELRTPLNAVIGMATLLGDTKLDDVQHDYVSTLRKGGDALLATVNDILELSKLDNGKVELEVRPYDAREVAIDVLHLLKPRAKEKGILLRFNGPKEPVWVQGDAHRVRQVLLNLVGNAVKFTDSGFVSVDLAQLPMASPCIRLRVEDTGIGIPEAKRAKVFEAFSQVDTSISRRYGGTGLGLAICKQLVTLMSGEISLRAKPSGGTVFDVTIPAPAAAAPDAPPSSRRNVELRMEGQLRERRPHVLVADDDAVNQKVARAFLERLGARVDCVNDGSEAIDAVRNIAYQVVLMDCQMPILDGYNATRQIRALPGPTCEVPVVALTANAFDEVRQRCIAAGMNAFLTKPIQRNALREVLHRMVCEPQTSNSRLGH